MLDIKLISQLRKKEHTYADIGRIVGVSRQRIHQILNKYTTRGYLSKKMKKFRDKGCGICRGKAIMLHHIDRNSHNNDIKNLLPVCLKCHGELHKGEKYKNTIRHFYIYICQQCDKRFKKIRGYGSKMKFCSTKCMGDFNKLESRGMWSKNYSECVVCYKTTKKHQGLGMCVNCYASYLRRKKREEDNF